MVVRFALQDGEGAVELFNKDEPNHLMGECHRGEGNLFVSAFIDRRGESIRAADDEDEPFG